MPTYVLDREAELVKFISGPLIKKDADRVYVSEHAYLHDRLNVFHVWFVDDINMVLIRQVVGIVGDDIESTDGYLITMVGDKPYVSNLMQYKERFIWIENRLISVKLAPLFMGEDTIKHLFDEYVSDKLENAIFKE